MKKVLFSAIAPLFFLLFTGCSGAKDKIVVDLNERGSTIPSSLYGIFFEEINHAGDGGLYAELVQNCSFEDGSLPKGFSLRDSILVPPPVINHLTGKVNQIEDRKMRWNPDPIKAWSLQVQSPDAATMKVTGEHPYFATAPNNLEVTINDASKEVAVINNGYWGMNIEDGGNYSLRTIIRVSPEYKGTVQARLLSENGNVLSSCPIELAKPGEWSDFNNTLTSKGKDTKAKLAIVFTGTGKIWLDYVSLFPENTFKNRKNGLRQDVAQMIVDMKPSFVRWPGGTIVGGITLDTRMDWKKMLGDPASRPGEIVTWGYRCSYGLGYYEMLQFCEDLGADFMFVCNVGFGDQYRMGNACPDNEIQFYVDDCLNAIEYAIGDKSTTWGARRAADGHPEPFSLKYVEVGNEHWGPEYDRRFNIFYDAIKKEYPQLIVISNHSLAGTGNIVVKTDMIDPHFYSTAENFYNTTNQFDNLPRGKYKVYIGEYACNSNVGGGHMNAALSEAAFLTGVERNSDLITMTSYAPLFENRNDRRWSTNMIWIGTDQVVGRSSYYVQKMVAENRPDYNVKYTVASSSNVIEYPKGKVGIGSINSQIEAKDIIITENGKLVHLDLARHAEKEGEWIVDEQNLKQTSLADASLYMPMGITSNNFTWECKVRKSSPNGGLRFIFGQSDNKDGFAYNVGSGRGGKSVLLRQHTAEHDVRTVARAECDSLKADTWYSLRVVITPQKSKLYIDNKVILEHVPEPLPEHFFATGVDEETNELVIKVVNSGDSPYSPKIIIGGAGQIEKIGKAISLVADGPEEENSFENPIKIFPQETEYRSFGQSFSYQFAPYSYTILRIKMK